VCTRLIYLTSFVLALSLVGNVQAQDATWTDAEGDHLWSTLVNWSEFPTLAHWAKIRNGLPGPIIDSEGAEARRVHIGYAEGGALTVDGGTLVVGTDDLLLGKNGGSGILNMISGTIDVARDFEVGGGDPGTVNMTGGTITVGDDFMIPELIASTAEVNLDSGTIIVNGDLDMRADGDTMNGTMNISGGTLIMNANALSTVQTYIDNGWITAYGTITASYGTGTVLVETVEDTLIVKGLHPFNPVPEDGGATFPGTVTLEWTVVAGTPVDVWFGTKADLSDFTKIVNKQAVTSKAVATVAKQQYFWAVDTYLPGEAASELGIVFDFTADNQAPVVDVGDDGTTWLENGIVDVALAGTVTDADPTTTVWSVVSQPDDPNSPDAVIVDPAALNTSITLSAVGDYVVQLEADDGDYQAADTLTISVYIDSCEAAKFLPDYVPLVGDLDEDCDVDQDDLDLLMENWLKCVALGECDPKQSE